MNKLPARTGIEWLKSGFLLFRQQPFLMTTLLLIHLLTILLLMSVPVIGQVVPILLIPSFAIAIQQACRLIDEGRPITFMVVLTGFQKESIGPLCKLGVVYLVAMVAIMLATSPFIDYTAMVAALKTADGARPETLDPALRTSLLVYTLMIVLVMITMLLLAFAPALTYWKRMPTFKAVFYSVFAIFGAAGPILTMLFAGLGIFLFVSMVFSLILGRTGLASYLVVGFNLVLSLVIQCGLFAAYKQILGIAEAEPALK